MATGRHSAPRIGSARAQLARFAIFFVVAPLGLWAMLGGPAGWRWPLGIGLWLAGGWLAEAAFRRLASPEEIRRDLRDRVDSLD
ncbi:hypothetical protein [uncultured Albimonas sp.]|uniref:hypothetical protein n=1 Tax=uncultured Albimonas sp. TaxID=1331701 RepID=UPI0030EEEB4B|tara:strand:- start:741 stop:992 length:252 start_codon:yes stop_codon:yes gene_type:complete